MWNKASPRSLHFGTGILQVPFCGQNSHQTTIRLSGNFQISSFRQFPGKWKVSTFFSKTKGKFSDFPTFQLSKKRQSFIHMDFFHRMFRGNYRPFLKLFLKSFNYRKISKISSIYWFNFLDKPSLMNLYVKLLGSNHH